MAKLTVTVDSHLCIGAAACIAEAPELFQLDEDNIASVNVPQPVEATPEQEKQLRAAAENCPTSAIRVNNS